MQWFDYTVWARDTGLCEPCFVFFFSVCLFLNISSPRIKLARLQDEEVHVDLVPW